MRHILAYLKFLVRQNIPKKRLLIGFVHNSVSTSYLTANIYKNEHRCGKKVRIKKHEKGAQPSLLESQRDDQLQKYLLVYNVTTNNDVYIVTQFPFVSSSF
jgi:hypothetical protein